MSGIYWSIKLIIVEYFLPVENRNTLYYIQVLLNLITMSNGEIFFLAGLILKIRKLDSLQKKLKIIIYNTHLHSFF